MSSESVNLWVPRLLLREEDLPVLEADEFYHHELLGLPVEDEAGVQVGSIVEITQGVVDVFTIRRTGIKEVIYVPFTKQHVLLINQEKDGHTKAMIHLNSRTV